MRDFPGRKHAGVFRGETLLGVSVPNLGQACIVEEEDFNG
jgi:hypothetical protein